MRTREPTILHRRNGTLPDELTEGIKWRGYGDPCKEAIIIPVRPTNGENVFAFLLIGVNPRRAFDEEYKAFVHMLNRQLTNSLASFLLFEEEVRKNRNAAEVATLQREQLSQQLEVSDVWIERSIGLCITHHVVTIGTVTNRKRAVLANCMLVYRSKRVE